MPIPIRVCHLVRHTICCHIGIGFFPVGVVPVSGMIERPFFIVGELALGGIALLCYFSQIRNLIRRDGGSTIMHFTVFQLIIFHGDLVYIELAIDRQVFLYGDIFLKCRVLLRGQCAADRGILEAGFTSHIERTERGIACDRELIIHGHVALEVRSISHVQRACVHSASVYAAVCSHFTFGRNIPLIINGHIFFDIGFILCVIASDTTSIFLQCIRAIAQ